MRNDSRWVGDALIIMAVCNGLGDSPMGFNAAWLHASDFQGAFRELRARMKHLDEPQICRGRIFPSSKQCSDIPTLARCLSEKSWLPTRLQSSARVLGCCIRYTTRHRLGSCLLWVQAIGCLPNQSDCSQSELDSFVYYVRQFQALKVIAS